MSVEIVNVTPRQVFNFIKQVDCLLKPEGSSTFKAPLVSEGINWAELEQNLSREYPLLLLTSDKVKYVLIDQFLIQKGDFVSIPVETVIKEDFLVESTSIGNMIVSFRNPKYISSFIEWARRVKSEPWKEEKVEYKISQPKI